MSNKRYPEEFKIEAIKQVTERGHSAPDVAKRFGVSQPTLYEWMKKYALAPEERLAQGQPARKAASSQGRAQARHRGARHPKAGRRVLYQRVPVKYAFIVADEPQHAVRTMCRVMRVHPSGYYAWKPRPESERTKDNRRLLRLIKQSWRESGGVYGYRKIAADLPDLGERCDKHRVYRLMRTEGLKCQTGYRRRAGRYGKPTVIAPNHLQQKLDAPAPNRVWVTDITYIRTHEGWLYLARGARPVLTPCDWLVDGLAY